MYRKDCITARDGSEIYLTFYAHASLGISWNGIQVYVDPVGEKYGIEYANEPKADLILITHQHADHLDINAVDSLKKNETSVFGSKKCKEKIDCKILSPFQQIRYGNIDVKVVPAYNITEKHICYHPHSDGGLGFILFIGGTSIYVAGDTEDNADILSLKDVDIAFLPVNQPYTMTVEQVCRVVRIIKPKILYPYHTSSKKGETDLFPLIETLQKTCDVRIRNMK